MKKILSPRRHNYRNFDNNKMMPPTSEFEEFPLLEQRIVRWETLSFNRLFQQGKIRLAFKQNKLNLEINILKVKLIKAST